jgi:hypothetical protein
LAKNTGELEASEEAEEEGEGEGKAEPDEREGEADGECEEVTPKNSVGPQSLRAIVGEDEEESKGF